LEEARHWIGLLQYNPSTECTVPYYGAWEVFSSRINYFLQEQEVRGRRRGREEEVDESCKKGGGEGRARCRERRNGEEETGREG
jgi:hypothetical protein